MINFKGSNVGVSFKPNLKEKTITANGEYKAFDDGVAGYNKLIIDVQAGVPLEVSLPSEFNSSTAILYYKYDDNRYFISTTSNSSSSPDSGLWLYDKRTGLVTKKSNVGYNWSSFQKIDGGAFFGSQYSNGILYYDEELDTFTQFMSGEARIDSFTNVDGDWLITGGTKNTTGVYLFDKVTKTVSHIYSESRDWIYIQVFSGGALLGSGTGTGILFYDKTTKTCSKLWTYSQYWLVTKLDEIDGDVLITSSSSGTGLLLFNGSTKQITQIRTTGYGWYYACRAGNKVVISSGNSVDKNILVYDILTKSITPILSSSSIGYTFPYLIPTNNNNVLMSMNLNAKIVLCDTSNNTLSIIYSSGYAWDKYFLFNDELFIYSSTQANGLLKYNPDDNTFTSIRASISNVNILKEFDNSLIFSSYQGTISYYNNSTQTLINGPGKSVYNQESNFNIIEELPNEKYIIKSSNKGINYIVQFDAINEVFSLAGFSIEG